MIDGESMEIVWMYNKRDANNVKKVSHKCKSK